MWTDRHFGKMIENQEKVLVGGSKKTQCSEGDDEKGMNEEKVKAN